MDHIHCFQRTRCDMPFDALLIHLLARGRVIQRLHEPLGGIMVKVLKE